MITFGTLLMIAHNYDVNVEIDSCWQIDTLTVGSRFKIYNYAPAPIIIPKEPKEITIN